MEPMNLLNQKFGKALHAVGRIVKDKTADTGKYTYDYADINDILAVVKDALTPLNLAISQPVTVSTEGVMSVTTLLIDIDTGEFLSFPGPGCPVKGDPQAAGSAITYFRRYALVCLFGLEADDDDGAQAHRAAVNPQKRTPAEVEIRDGIAKMAKDEQAAFAEDFKTEFNSTLTNLPESKHGDALGYYHWWVKEDANSNAKGDDQ